MSGTDPNSERRPRGRLAVLTSFEIIDKLNFDLQIIIPTIDTRRSNHEKDSCCHDCRRALPGSVRFRDGSASWTWSGLPSGTCSPSRPCSGLPSGTSALSTGSAAALSSGSSAAPLLSSAASPPAGSGCRSAARARSAVHAGVLLSSIRHLSQHSKRWNFHRAVKGLLADRNNIYPDVVKKGELLAAVRLLCLIQTAFI